jgi:hypothetical protein
MFTGRGKHPTMILEAVASYDLWIWHAYFGLPGSCNDINVLERELGLHLFPKLILVVELPNTNNWTN